MNSFKGIDLQVNGWGGVNFSDPSLSLEATFRVADTLARAGVEKFLPTVVTTSEEDYKTVLPILGNACRQDGRLPGIHLEGPFISPEDGAVGAHPKGCVAAPSIGLFRRFQEWADGHVRLVTLAPEVAGALELIEYLVENNVVVSVGHTLASSQEIQDACSAGATLATHVGNGISNQLNRTDNTLWSILASPLTVMLITDGFHLPENFIKAVYAAKGAGKIILVSDAAPVAGQPPGEYEIFGTRVRLTEEGCVRNLNAPTLAGSASDLAQCAKVCKEVLGVDGRELEQMCFGNAAALLEV
jgi:N-acetylglucosamine-6-phosphate deacetylase